MLDRAFLKDPADYRNVLRRLAGELQTTIDLDALLGRTITTLTEAMLLRTGHVVVFGRGAPIARSGAGAPLEGVALERIARLLGGVPAGEGSFRVADPVEGLEPGGPRVSSRRWGSRWWCRSTGTRTWWGRCSWARSTPGTPLTSEDAALLATAGRAGLGLPAERAPAAGPGGRGALRGGTQPGAADPAQLAALGVPGAAALRGARSHPALEARGRGPLRRGAGRGRLVVRRHRRRVGQGRAGRAALLDAPGLAAHPGSERHLAGARSCAASIASCTGAPRSSSSPPSSWPGWTGNGWSCGSRTQGTTGRCCYAPATSGASSSAAD